MTKPRTIGPVRIRPQVKYGKETGKWFVDIPASLTSSGQRKRKLFDNQIQATKVARELRRRVDPVTGLLKVRKPKGVKLVEAVEGWERDEWLRVQTLKKRKSTLQVDKYRLKALTSYFKDRAIGTITEKCLTQYQAHRLALGRKPLTVNSELTALSLVFSWAVKQGVLKDYPKPEPIPVRPAQADIPSPEEVVRIIQALPARLRPLVRFLAETGCRKGEAVNLTWDCVDEIGGYAEIRSRDGWTPKTQQSERRIPLNPDLLKMLRSQRKEGPYVFSGEAPNQPVGDFKKAWATAVRKAGIARRGRKVHLPIKCLRKAHATWQAERGTHESVLQGLLGHAKGSRITKQFYVQATEEAKRTAVIALPFEEIKERKSA